MMIRWEETGQDNCDAMKEWQSVWQTSKTNRRSYMLSWLPHPTFVPVAIKTTNVIGMEAQAFFPILVATSGKSRENLYPSTAYCNRSQYHSEGECN